MYISESSKTHLVLAADDYGIRDTVNQILPLAEAGLLDRVAVMVKYCSPEDAQKLRSTRVKIDIHLDIINLLGRGAHTGHGTFRRSLHFALRHFLGAVPAKAVEAEWRSQIETFHTLFGQYPDGLNSHEHVHFFPAFFRVIISLAHEYRIPYVRLGRLGMLLPMHHSPIGHILHQLARINHRRFTAAGLATSTYLVSLNWVQRKQHFFQSLESLSVEETVELVIHPERRTEADFVRAHFSSTL